MSAWPKISEHVSAATGVSFCVRSTRAVGGGCINSAYVMEGDKQRYFVKINAAARAHMFEAEALGLREIAHTDTVRVPQPVCWGSTEGSGYLVLEYIEFGSGTTESSELLGQQLARMHRFHASRYGWHIDNTIGTTPQINMSAYDWVAFWREHRLGYQLRLAARNGYGGGLQRQGERLLESFGALFTDYRPLPALLHGDLWGGNHAADAAGNPVIFDPAVYYGDRETDLAMTELFGGFGNRFYQAYRAEYPLDQGYETRKTLYNLYHVLNHLNLFGGSYLAQAQRMIDLLLSEIA